MSYYRNPFDLNLSQDDLDRERDSINLDDVQAQIDVLAKEARDHFDPNKEMTHEEVYTFGNKLIPEVSRLVNLKRLKLNTPHWQSDETLTEICERQRACVLALCERTRKK
jgi:hypothetical protein